ncbi:MAG: UDP-glucose 4-epimerase, partial [Clostridiaceae bacterium]|nr:UDP-glucose 4-epimerase [Clostridiaceae bacterium]
MAVLVAGGAGYIGSHTAAELVDNGEEVVVVDNLVKGHREAVGECRFYHGDLTDICFLDSVFSENKIDSVIDFAASSLVGESMSKPLDYYKNNLISVMNLLDKMKEYEVPVIVFSSTAAVYGEPENIPILETDRTEPTNPYGETKLAIEKMLKWCEKAYGIKYATLRYFNAAGAR